MLYSTLTPYSYSKMEQQAKWTTVPVRFIPLDMDFSDHNQAWLKLPDNVKGVRIGDQVELVKKMKRYRVMSVGKGSLLMQQFAPAIDSLPPTVERGDEFIWYQNTP